MESLVNQDAACLDAGGVFILFCGRLGSSDWMGLARGAMGLVRSHWDCLVFVGAIKHLEHEVAGSPRVRDGDRLVRHRLPVDFGHGWLFGRDESHDIAVDCHWFPIVSKRRLIAVFG